MIESPFPSPLFVSSFSWDSLSSSTRLFLCSFSFRPFSIFRFWLRLLVCLLHRPLFEAKWKRQAHIAFALLCFALGSSTSMTRILSIGAAALAASSVIGSASAATLYAFYTGTDAGVQIGMQDPSSGDIWVNDCSKMNNGNPLFPTDTPLVLPVSTPVKMGGSIAATGWWDSQKVITSVFWHSVNGTIVNAIYNCDNESGTFVRQGPEYVISETANVKNSSIHENTGLAVELLGSTAGYRVYYHDNNSQVQELFYTTKTNWNYGGIVSQDPVSSFALGTGHSATDNITVVFPKSDKDIEVSRFNSDKSWHISTFPDTLENSPTNKTDSSKIAIDSSVTANFTLPAWNGAPRRHGRGHRQHLYPQRLLHRHRPAAARGCQHQLCLEAVPQPVQRGLARGR
ncbi:uncharacterized protein TrAtP1_002443 [Trichoderma atroviride]|uniref:uncharacterized protein n=1 Tax=Hypocrea atroviridis TaxID=63577 RepID=UPI00331D09F8|nr:hypothetical protein TrAtP1_002443 [Trichoderma atroviride]